MKITEEIVRKIIENPKNEITENIKQLNDLIVTEEDYDTVMKILEPQPFAFNDETTFRIIVAVDNGTLNNDEPVAEMYEEFGDKYNILPFVRFVAVSVISQALDIPGL